jgi:hypothetical protein
VGSDPTWLKRISNAGVLVVLAVPVGVTVFAPKPLVAVLVLFVAVGAFSVAGWIWATFASRFAGPS